MRECRGMEVPPLQTGEGTKVDVNGSPEAIPTRKFPLLLALEPPKRVASIEKVKPYALVSQARSRSIPIAEEVDLVARVHFMAVRATERFLPLALGLSWRRKDD